MKITYGWPTGCAESIARNDPFQNQVPCWIENKMLLWEAMLGPTPWIKQL